MPNRCALAGLAALCLLSGCSRQAPPEPPPAAQTPAPVAAGPSAPASPVAAPAGELDHAHKAPHGGLLVELGEEFAHLELLLDAASGRLTVYVLDGEAEQAVRLAQKEIVIEIRRPALGEVVLTAVASALTGESVGDSSQFVGQSPALKGAARFEASVRSVSVRGRTFEGAEIDYPKGRH
jgi:hypothetical protein